MKKQYKYEIVDGVFVSFPKEPIINSIENGKSYGTQLSNCIFFALVQNNVIPNYTEFLSFKDKISENQISDLENNFFDSAIESKLKHSSSFTFDIEKFKISKFSGRKFSFYSQHPTTNERVLHTCMFILVDNKAVNLEVISPVKEDRISSLEKESFFNSISIK